MPAVISPDFPTDDPYYLGRIIFNRGKADTYDMHTLEGYLRCEFEACLKDVLYDIRQDRKDRGIPEGGL